MDDLFTGYVLLVCGIVLTVALSISLIIFTINKTSPNCDLNHDNELTIKDLSILAAQISNQEGRQ